MRPPSSSASLPHHHHRQSLHLADSSSTSPQSHNGFCSASSKSRVFSADVASGTLAPLATLYLSQYIPPSADNPGDTLSILHLSTTSALRAPTFISSLTFVATHSRPHHRRAALKFRHLASSVRSTLSAKPRLGNPSSLSFSALTPEAIKLSDRNALSSPFLQSARILHGPFASPSPRFGGITDCRGSLLRK